MGYGPLTHEEPAHAWWGGYTQLLKCSLGIGLLAMPFAVSVCGWLLSLVLLFVVAFLSLLSMKLLLEASEIIRERSPNAVLQRTSFASLAFHCGMSPTFRLLTVVAVVVSQIGTTSGYLVFVATNMKQVLWPELSSAVSVLIVAGPLAATCFIRHFRQLLVFSVLGLVSLAVGLVALLWHCSGGVHPEEPASFEAGTPSGMWRFLGIAMFAAEGIVCVPSLLFSLRPEARAQGGSILTASVVTSTALFASFGLLGWACIGQNVSAVITARLPADTAAGFTAKVAFSLFIYCTFPLQLYPVSDTLHGFLYPDHVELSTEATHHHTELTVFRVGGYVVSVVLAALVQGLGALLALLGWLAFGYLSFVAPAAMYLAVTRYRSAVPTSRLWLLFLFLWGGAAFSLVGFAFALKEAVEDTSGKDTLSMFL